MNRQQFLEYADHFNNHRWGKVVSYFCPEVTVEYPCQCFVSSNS